MKHPILGCTTSPPPSAMRRWISASASVCSVSDWSRRPSTGRSQGAGQIGVTSFSVPAGSLDSWSARLREHGIAARDVDIDFHVPKARVDESAAIFERMGAQVTTRLYAGRGHLINDDELVFARTMMDRVGGTPK